MLQFTREQLKSIADYIEGQVGISYPEANYYQLEGRLEQLMKRLGISSRDELIAMTNRGLFGTAKELLLDLATNNETFFFRDRPVFDAIRNLVLPEVRRFRPAQARFTAWSAASSTGQEAYSLAMLLSELPVSEGYPPFQILATDYSERVLAQARKGEYSQLEVQRGLPTDLLLKYFIRKSEDCFLLREEIRGRVSIDRVNLLEDFSRVGTFDLILLRNVLIYQSVENKRRIIQRATERLNPHGFLILGAAESMLGLSDRFRQLSAPSAVVHQRID